MGVELATMATADAAARYLRAQRRRAQREQLRRQLDRVDAALVAWREYHADWALSPDRRRYPPAPDVPRATLPALHAALVRELARIDGG